MYFGREGRRAERGADRWTTVKKENETAERDCTSLRSGTATSRSCKVSGGGVFRVDWTGIAVEGGVREAIRVRAR